MLGDRADAIVFIIMASLMGGACHSLTSIPGQGVFVALTGAVSLIAGLAAVDCWFGFPVVLRLAGHKN